MQIVIDIPDAISSAELIEALNTLDKFGYTPTKELIPLKGNTVKDKYVSYVHYDDVIKCIKGIDMEVSENWEVTKNEDSTR